MILSIAYLQNIFILCCMVINLIKWFQLLRTFTSYYVFPLCHENLRDMFAQWILHSLRSTCSRQGHSNLGSSLCRNLESRLSLTGKSTANIRKPCMIEKTWSIVVSSKLLHHPILGLNAKPGKCRTLLNVEWESLSWSTPSKHHGSQMTNLFVVVIYTQYTPLLDMAIPANIPKIWVASHRGYAKTSSIGDCLHALL